MRPKISFPILLLFAPVVMWAASGVSLQISFHSLQQIDVLASGGIESLDDAKSYVTKSAELCGITEPALVSDDIESRLAAAEWDAARDPTKLVSDEQVAKAFNYISSELGIKHAAVLTAGDVLQYRSVQAALWPHIFSPKSVGGSRPVGAIVMLYRLWYSGGITGGVRKAADLDRPPGSLKVTGGHIVGHSGIGNSNPLQSEYRTASQTYFARQSQQEKRTFFNRLAGIVALPGGR